MEDGRGAEGVVAGSSTPEEFINMESSNHPKGKALEKEKEKKLLMRYLLSPPQKKKKKKHVRISSHTYMMCMCCWRYCNNNNNNNVFLYVPFLLRGTTPIA